MTPAPYDLAIIGGGAAGALVAMHCLARDPGMRIAIVEPRAALARGVAYSTTRDEHLLNVTADRMGWHADLQGDFVAWLQAVDGEGAADVGHDFMPRRRFGDYLAARLADAAASGSVVHVHEHAVACEDAGRTVLLASGERLHARACVLATGNASRPLPWPVPAEVAARVCEAWDLAAIAAIPPDARVAIVGTGLSMVDIVLALRGQQHRGAITALSRHALLPLPHEPTHMALDVDIDALAMLPLRARMRRLRALAAEAMAGGLPWQGVMQALRPYGVRLWQSLSPADQARFLRHVVRGWDVHRHRIAPQVVDMLDAMRADGQLRVDAARLAAITADGGQVVLHAAAHGAGAARCWQVDHVVNATGIQSRFPVAGDALQASLLAAGLARPGPFGLGVDVDGDGALRDRHGTAGAHLFAIGSLRIGAEWESIAVPDLRLQAARIAARLRPAARSS
ncbi:FAD/NAD(P)-binding protein [Luteimonas sp. MC1825]|uniref:FAD/NAD(P)-binding protein n=1 Tax=Luteimonas sp. MC1825 TaxID=2761107 RepID=UPI0016100472|nr:FAD/NAD(P)-binding protein [Luteimonas sp. MC1825]MBB6600222.1 FAD/NAD(P)-binding protein [Luteimonas sp. MC1825]QOC87909.1 FAD/NAD(P)-binding protein [Luteimonas sp. MC1825]